MQNKTTCLPRVQRLVLENCVAARNQIVISFAADELCFRKCYSYFDVDFDDLKARYGDEFIQRLCFHLAALEAIPLISLQPQELDFGSFARFHTARFEHLWRRVLLRAGAQWRYENKLPDYRGPRFVSSPAGIAFQPVIAERGSIEALCFCGGGKDSLAMLKLFECAGLPFSAYSYSHPTYGAAEAQFELIQSLLDSTAPVETHRAEIADDFSQKTQRASFGIDSQLSAETPISIFGALPVALQHGYEWLVLGNERSADDPNLQWQQTGELVNHQWGKSFEAELLMGEYIHDELISNLRCFSVLRPLHDPVIFHMLRRYPEAVRRTHSCNHKKPWCRCCAKCAYVGLGFMAYLPAEVAREVAPPDLLDAPANEIFFRQLLGLTAHKPFECVGEIGETRLAFEVCLGKGMRGRAIDLYVKEARPQDAAPLAQIYSEIELRAHSIPPALWRILAPLMSKAGEEAFDYVSSTCGFERQFAQVIAGKM